MRLALCTLVILPLALSAAQIFPAGPAEPVDSKNPPEEAHLKLALEALEDGRARDAMPHLQRAHGVGADRGRVLHALLRAATLELDDDGRLLWAHALAGCEADAKGKWRPDRELKELLPEGDAHLTELPGARASAARQLAKLAGKLRKAGRRHGGTPLGARFAAQLAWLVARPMPELAGSIAKDLEKAAGDYEPDHKTVVSALSKLCSHEEIGVAVRAARCLQGLAAQAGFGDLKGPEAPDMSRAQEEARQALFRARAALAQKTGEPLTLAQLEAMTPAEREQFTAAHSSFDNPGVSVSPTGMYRIETVCGFETLLGATRTIEDHHRRLAHYFGRDPFEERQGIVRIVPQHAGLEAEGTPHWWAGGFQSGDVTTIQFSVGNIEGMGRTLTHELTHRFDGVIFPGMPAWIVEGRAVWTGAAYGHSSDTQFVPNHVRIGTVESAFIKGYGGKKRLEQLITGTIDDYRDNYVAGYALWVYLDTWQVDGKRVFQGQLRKWMDNAPRGIRSPKPYFEQHFCDGKAGRPATFDDFAKEWRKFLKAFHWQSREDWVKERYTTRIKGGKRSPWVYDTPTWHRQRNRAEPFFGQDQARIAGDLFLELDMRDEARLAYAWALEVDEWEPAMATTLAELLEEDGADDLAWILRTEIGFRQSIASRARSGWEPSEPPFARDLDDLHEYLEALAAAAADYRAAGKRVAAAALTAERDRIARIVGLQPLGVSIDETAVRASLHPLDALAEPLGAWGYVEDELTGHEERRVHDLWYENEDGDVFVGRKKPQEGTGTADRGLWRREIFVRSREWQPPGKYLLSTRVFLTTSYVTGTVVFGYGRRDRNLRFRFNAGDYMYSAGEREKANALKSVGWSMGDLRGRDGGLSGSAPGRRYEFKEERSSFRLEILVDGAEAHAFIEDDWVGSYHTIDGRPIEGYIGFAVSWGAVRMQQPTIRRFDRTLAAGLERRWGKGLDLQSPGRAVGNQLLNRRVTGIPVGDRGTLALWLPHPPKDDDVTLTPEELAAEALDSIEVCRRILDEHRYPMRLVAVAPSTHDAPTREAIQNHLDTLFPGTDARGQPKVELLTHDYEGGISNGAHVDAFGEERTLLLLLDEHGVLRILHNFFPGWKDLPGPMRHWAKVLRGRR